MRLMFVFAPRIHRGWKSAEAKMSKFLKGRSRFFQESGPKISSRSRSSFYSLPQHPPQPAILTGTRDPFT
ncbi:MAG TPA: hypothetical protein VLS90_13600, partial [Thermodesulfobacteriota bacterium]|nr:hypothetical protein [Thermodesulfobacteriota bacterium]